MNKTDSIRPSIIYCCRVAVSCSNLDRVKHPLQRQHILKANPPSHKAVEFTVHVTCSSKMSSWDSKSILRKKNTFVFLRMIVKDQMENDISEVSTFL